MTLTGPLWIDITGLACQGNRSIADALELHLNGLVQERRNSIANALELRLSCTNPWISWH